MCLDFLFRSAHPNRNAPLYIFKTSKSEYFKLVDHSWSTKSSEVETIKDFFRPTSILEKRSECSHPQRFPSKGWAGASARNEERTDRLPRKCCSGTSTQILLYHQRQFWGRVRERPEENRFILRVWWFCSTKCRWLRKTWGVSFFHVQVPQRSEYSRIVLFRREFERQFYPKVT